MAAPRKRNAEQSLPTSTRQNPLSSAHIGKFTKTEHTQDSTIPLLTERFWILVIGSCIALFILVHIQYHSYPSPVAVRSDDDDVEFKDQHNSFLEHNAREVLEELCAHGTRHLGSDQNEIVAVEFFKTRIKSIQNKANAVHSVEFDLQTTSGCYDLDFVGRFSNCYTNVNNILVRIAPRDGSKDGILVNCHYDTAISSPGASDDLASCAIMLETLRVLSESDIPLRHSIIFNFNGGEETILQASHGFITGHKWAAELRAFVNLEAAGVGGRELVFQTGPENPWLIDAYARSAKYPFASVMGQEVFQSGVIPSDTDFRIYRDFGNIPGIDVAYTYNGYIYHTIYDVPKYIPEGCLQRGGDNLLSLLKTMGNADEVADPGDSRLGKMVFFDVLGYFMVYYPEKLGKIINCFVIIATLLNLYRKLKQFQSQGMKRSHYLRLLLASWSIHAISFFTMALVVVLVALQNTMIRPMMWFTNNWMIVPMYCFPAIAACILVQKQGRQFYSELFKLVSMWHLESIFFEAALLFWTSLLALMTGLGLASAYMCLLLVAFPLAIRQIVVDTFNIKMQDQPTLFVTLTLSSLFVPAVHITQLLYSLFIMFIPLMGRSGSEVVPDIVVGIFAFLPVAVFSINLVSLFYVSKDLSLLVVKLMVISLVFTAIGWVTPLGMPYSGNEMSPSAQRHVLHHFSREFYNKDGSLDKADHGLMYLPFDFTGSRYLQSYPEFANVTMLECDSDKAYCGMPYYLPLITMLKKVYINPVFGKPTLQNRVIVTHSRGAIYGSKHRFIFTTNGEQTHLNIYISVQSGAELVAWSFTPGKPVNSKMPSWIQDDHYFVYTTSAQTPKPDRKFWLDVQMPADYDPSMSYVNVGFAAHYLDGPDSLTPEMQSLMSSMPNWTIPIGWSVTFQHYKI